MRYFPVNLDLKGKRAVVIGGGEVAARKVIGLLEAGAEVQVVSPEADESIRRLHQEGRIGLKKKGYERGDLENAFLAVAATDDRQVNQSIRQEALEKKILLNIVDKPEFCDFVFPSRVQRGEFLITISTGGASPALSKKIRQDLEKIFGEEYATLVDLLGKIRQQIPAERRRSLEENFSRFVRTPILEAIRRGDSGEIWKLVEEHFGKGIEPC